MLLDEAQIHEIEIPDGKELLEDVFELVINPGDLIESKDGEKRPYLKGRLGLVDEATANKRLYPRNLMVREISKLKEDMGSRGVYGELDHPSDGKTLMQRVSHFVRDAEVIENGEIQGTIEFIPGTRNGDQALAIARAGGRMGVSSRGFGSTASDAKGNDVVQEDYTLVTWDIVADPANAGAHPNFVVENKEIDMDLDKLKKEHPALVEAIKSEVDSESRTHAREALREEFEEQLRTEGETIREEAVSVARSQLLEDPEVAGSVTAIDRIKEVISPFILVEDENREMTKLKDKIRGLEQKIAEQDEAMIEARSEIDEMSDIAKEMGYHLYLERELRDNERASQVVEMLGEVTEYDSLDNLKDRVTEILNALSEDDEVREKYEDRIAQLEKRLVLTEGERDKALNIGKQFGIRAYIERKVSNHPHGPTLRTYLDETKPSSKDEVDRLVESYTKAHPLSNEFKRIRAGLNEDKKMLEEVHGTQEKEENLLEEGSILGVSMGELRERSGLNGSK